MFRVAPQIASLLPDTAVAVWTVFAVERSVTVAGVTVAAVPVTAAAAGV